MKSINTEVKFLLDSNIALSSNYELSDEVKNAFKVCSEGRPMRIWYLDTPSFSLHKENWILRFRYMKGKDFELTYKKRFSVNEYETLCLTKEVKLFSDFKLEIDKSFSKSTCSLSFIKKFAATRSRNNLYSI